MKILRPIVFVSVLLLCGWSAASAQDLKDYEERKSRIEKEIEMLDRQLSDNVSRSRSELSRLSLLRAKVEGRKAIIAESDRQIRRYSDEIYRTQRNINAMQARLDTLSDHYTTLVRNAYKNRDAKIWYMYILSSENLGQAFRRYNYFKNLSSQMRVQADKIRQALMAAPLWKYFYTETFSTSSESTYQR